MTERTTPAANTYSNVPFSLGLGAGHIDHTLSRDVWYPSLLGIMFRVYGKARYSQIRRYCQIQNGLARVFKHSRERDSPRKPLSPECLNTLAREISPLFLISIENLSRQSV